MRTPGEQVILLFKALLTIGIAAIVCSFSFDYLESLTYDARFRLSPNDKVSGVISAVAVDRKTIESLKRKPFLADHTAFLTTLISENPKAIVYLEDPSNLVGSTKDKLRFSELANITPNFYVAYNDVPLKGEEYKLQLKPPFNKIRSSPAVLSMDSQNFSEDGVTRRALVSANGMWFLHAELANKINGFTDPNQYRGIFNFKGTKQILVDHRRPGTFPRTSFVDVLNRRFAKGDFTDRIILIGVDSMADTNDYMKSVFSRDTTAIAKLDVHANVVESLIQNRGILRPPVVVDVMLTMLISALTVISALSAKPIRGLITILGILSVFVLISWTLFATLRISIGMAHPLIAIFVCYYFFVPYRLIRENRKSWEYQQKNTLLTQVEELKTNFLGMMSHDLKTPLARIQGMADIALAETQNLSPTQKEALKSITKSSEELTEFISSILDLTRVESQNIKLKYESKDINQLLDQVLIKYDYLAKEKNISFIKDFEPLFSVKVDVGLMQQVFSNLIENAIKYSPEGSKVLISTEEVGARIMVQVADQGIGIPSDEINNVFMKFYRSSNVKSSPTKGSGLGLYLAKYFVELHKGTISVESKPQQGSTFTVGLPNV